MSMTPKERAAMQQALEALEAVSTAKERGFGIEYAKGYVDPVITALREALAEQAEQEPVAWVWLDDWLNDGYPEDCFSRVNHQNKTPLYAAPVRTKDLTDDEIMKINVDTASIVPTCDRQFHFARAVIAADREKNK